MPVHFDAQMIEDAIQCIRACDVIADDAKARLIRAVRALRQPSCAIQPSCGACPSCGRCEDRIGAILNGEAAAVSEEHPWLRLVLASVA